MLQLHIQKETVFLGLGFDYSQLLIKLCVIRSFFAYFHAKVLQILRKRTYGH